MLIVTITLGFCINAMDKPTTIENWSNRADFKSVSDVVRDHLSNESIYNKCIDQLRKYKTHYLFVLLLHVYNLLSTPLVIIILL